MAAQDTLRKCSKRELVFFKKKNQICDCFRSKQILYKDKITEIIPYLRTYFLISIYFKYNDFKILKDFCYIWPNFSVKNVTCYFANSVKQEIVNQRIILLLWILEKDILKLKARFFHPHFFSHYNTQVHLSINTLNL